MSQRLEVTDLRVSIDHHQLILCGEPEMPDDGEDPPPAVRAVDDAHASGRGVGVAAGLIVLTTPVQFHVDAPVRVELWDNEPGLSEDTADHAVDIDVDLPRGQLYFFRSPFPEAAAQCAVAPGRYRARIGGSGFNEAASNPGVEGGPDSYSVRIWPRDHDSGPELRRTWPGRNMRN